MCAAGALAFIPTNNLMVEEARLVGLSVEQSSNPIAAMSMFAYTLGGAVGPLASGGMVEAVGFPRACALVGLGLAASALLFLLVALGVRRRRRRKTPTQRMHERLLEQLPVSS